MDVVAAAERWIAHDPDPSDRKTLSEWVGRAKRGDAGALDRITGAMTGRLFFGTAGLRGEMGPGPNRMNTATVATATAGLCAVLGQMAEHPRMVIGFDARHRSAQFARTAAGVATAARCDVMVMPRALPTPLLAFAVRHLGADAGIMVTASHNPAADNGYKVYLGGRIVAAHERGVQLVDPMDSRVMAAIEEIGWADEVPVADDGWRVLDETIVDEYLAAAGRLAGRLGVNRDQMAGLTVVFTAMHGVGAPVATRLLESSGVSRLYPVAAQCSPDPDFPTIAFPNPEEAGALDLACDKAREVKADLVVALDPDADRCAVAVPDRSGAWRQLSGDQLGALLAQHLAARIPVGEGGGEPPVFARSLVSGSMCDAIAAAHGITARQSLTGFKWIVRGPGVVYGYEEAIGYCCDPGAVPDKDGLTAALMVLELAAGLRAEGLTLADRLDELTAELGLHATSQLAIRVSDLSLIADAMARLRENPPTSLLHAPVTYRDLAEGTSGLPPTDAVELSGDEVHVVVRPSGTEPKLKCYLEVRLTPERSRTGAAARLAAEIRMMALRGQIQSVLGLG